MRMLAVSLLAAFLLGAATVVASGIAVADWEEVDHRMLLVGIGLFASLRSAGG